MSKLYKADYVDEITEPREDNAEVREALTESLKMNAELLDALKAFLRAPSIGSNGPGSHTIEVQDFNLRAARAAIAKAERGRK